MFILISMDTELNKLFLWTAILILGCSAEDGESLRKEMVNNGMTGIEYTTLWDDNSVLGRPKSEEISDHLMNPIKMTFEYSGEKFSLELSPPEPILHSSAEILTFTSGSPLPWTGAHPDCFLTGSVTSHQGKACLSLCDGVFGIIRTAEQTLHLQSLPGTSNTHPIPVLVARQKDKSTCSNPTENLTGNNLNVRNKRSVPSRNITIELAVFTDAAYTRSMLVTDYSKRLQHILMKYHAVQMEWSRSDMLGYNVKLVLKKVHFYETEPSWYISSRTLLGDVMSDFCKSTTNEGTYDIRYMHVGLPNLDVLGRAYQSSVCNQRYNCAVDTSTYAASFVATAHEIGHLMGMPHDADLGCTGSDVGVMGGYGAGWSSCSKTALNTLLESGNQACLWEENIPSKDVPQNLIDITLKPEIPGQAYSPDEICGLRYGAGYRFRKYPKLGVCVYYTCANHNRDQSNYGQMFRESLSIYGMYCDTQKVCFKLDCVAPATAKLDSLVERQGGWSQWGAWTGCTRTCGRGINSRSRKCDNPTPISLEGCPGDEYEAEPCNKEPCASDSSDQTTLQNQRAGETCKKLRDANVINPDNLKETGSRYSSTAHGQCEVTCDPVSGYTIPTFTRFGFMPDGVSCVGGSNTWDLNNWPRKSGSYYMCLDGLCQRFGCDNQYNGKVFDECGVCGGDNSTCTVIEKTDSQLQNNGERRTIALLPKGAFNIQFWFSYAAMKKNFLEVYDMKGKVILASMIGSSWKWDTRTEPVLFGGTQLYYFFHDQFLHFKGPLNESCEIKLFQNDVNNNVGVNFAFSEPKPVHFDCDFEGGTCGLTLTNFTQDTYSSTNIIDSSPPTKGFGNSFVYIASKSVDEEGTILTSTVAGTSQTQCLAFHYYISGTNSNITLSWNSSSSDAFWEITNPEFNSFVCVSLNISTLEEDKILIKGVTKASDKGSILLDNIKLFPNSGAFCNSQESCSKDVIVTTTPKLEVTTSGSRSTTEITKGITESYSKDMYVTTTPRLEVTTSGFVTTTPRLEVMTSGSSSITEITKGITESYSKDVFVSTTPKLEVTTSGFVTTTPSFGVLASGSGSITEITKGITDKRNILLLVGIALGCLLLV
ncbi:A disintegrin and metalloproteinase with thrombospondin motifs 5-like isoform X3 [Ostrea edulis]|nr:A disintegrin and metalloproteinase with thrombospondin motifs 5-like isoform X3 [Ostrea edulis]